MGLCGTDHSDPSYTHSRRSVRQQRSAFTRMCCVLYCMIFCVFGFVFPVCDAITKSSTADHRLYTEIFHIIIYVVSILQLLYFFAYILRQGGTSTAMEGKEELELKGLGISNPAAEIKPKDPDYDYPVNSSTATLDGRSDKAKSTSSTERGPPLSMAEEGLNLYTRIGTIVFAVGTIMLKVFRIIEPYHEHIDEGCVSKIFYMVQGIYVVLVILQTAFIFKFHQVVINKHKPFVRMCLMHLIATNLSVWLSGCTSEIVEDVGELLEEEHHHTNKTTRCHHVDSIADHSSPYIFPCLIEYSLIAAAASFRMYLNVGKVMDIEDMAKHGEETPQPSNKPREGLTFATFKRLWVGSANIAWIVSGTLISTVVIAGVILFLVVREGDVKIDPLIATYIYLFTDMLALFSCLLAIGFGFKIFRNLKFHPLEEDSFDDKLLLLAQVGVFTYSTMLAISAISNLTAGFNETMYLYLVRAILNFIQSGIQTVFVLNCLRRCAGNDDHVRTTPGRTIITFLIMVNLALWLVNTFEMEKAEVNGIQVTYFDKLSWSIISHMLIPLVIFYRYHTTVCLSDIWSKAYEKRKHF